MYRLWTQYNNYYVYLNLLAYVIGTKQIILSSNGDQIINYPFSIRNTSWPITGETNVKSYGDRGIIVNINSSNIVYTYNAYLGVNAGSSASGGYSVINFKGNF